MKKILVVCVGLLVVTCLQAQSKDEQAVASAVETLKAGLLGGDRTTLEGIAAEELTYGHSSGLIQNKKEFVEDLASGKSDFTKVDLTKQSIRITGDIALVRHELHGEVNGGPVNLGVLLVWRKEKGSWKLLARQAFKL